MPPKTSRSVSDRIWDRVDSSAGPAECWPWRGSMTPVGYGTFSWRENGRVRARMVSRMVYEMSTGVNLPTDLQVDHLCHSRSACEGGVLCPHRACCNPSHLEAVTIKENYRRSAHNQQRHLTGKTHCPQGHPYDEANTYRAPGKTSRSCKACTLERTRVRRARLRLEMKGGRQ